MTLNKKKKAAILAAAMSLGVGSQVSAMERVPIMWNGKQLFEVQYYGAEDRTDVLKEIFQKASDGSILPYTLTANIKDGLNKAFYWWAEILGPGVIINQPAQYFVATISERSANASSMSLMNGDLIRNPDLFSEIFQNGRIVPYFSTATEVATIEAPLEPIAFGTIHFGQNLGINENNGQYSFVNMDYYAFPLPKEMKGIDTTPVMYHEIAHSLGITADRRGENPYGLQYDGNPIMYWGDGAANPYNFTSHLRDQYGNAAREGMFIMTTEMFNDETLRAQYLEAAGKELTADNVFFVDDLNVYNGRDGRTGIYFVGDNVLEVLEGKTFTRLDGTEVSGIPILMWEMALFLAAQVMTFSRFMASKILRFLVS